MNEYQRLLAYLKILYHNLTTLHRNLVKDGAWFANHKQIGKWYEEVASEISKEDKNWQWEAREIKQHSLLLWWEYLEDEKQEGFRIEYDEAEEVFNVYDEWDNEITYELEDTLDLKSTMRSVFWYASSRY